MNVPLRLHMSAHIHAPAQDVFDRIVQYGAFSHLHAAVEAVRVELRSNIYDSFAPTEQIIEWDPPHRYVVRAEEVPGLPGEHIAVVTIEEHDEAKCTLCWKHYFEHPEAELATEHLRFSVCGCMNDLVAIFGGTILQS